ncbi:DUF2188 domain-containing protein [Microbacterium arborescens]|uniref:DUF2188 domain-containing protein n=1 Tax=Microbacterium arborescens TaxID=33883 RepID=UPI002787D5B7|nr:DUF2188 domain-containing protein [Microbacterium arborescens]MDQ1215729.1 hypothetical protein [Microbacterium arborescens]
MAAQQAFVVPVSVLWAVKVRGQTIGRFHSTQADATSAARTWLAGHGGGELVILNQQGQIRQKDTIRPGNDPRNIRG